MKDSKTLVVLAALIIIAAFFMVVQLTKAEPTPGSQTMTVDTTPALELESYQDTVDAYDLQPATNIQ